MNLNENFPVFGSTHKKFRSHHSVLTTSKTLNRLKNQQLFLDPLERRHRASTASKIGEKYK